MTAKGNSGDGSSANQTPRRVLIVDDNPDLRFLTRLNLEGSRCEVVGEAANGQEAVEAVAKLEPDIVIMDMKMPVMDGLEATRQITQRFPDVDVIVVSGSDDPAMMRRILAAGARASIDKANLENIVAEIDRRQ